MIRYGAPRENYFKFLHSIAPERRHIVQCSVENLNFALSSPPSVMADNYPA
jgi:hypothetical protein